MSEPAGIAATSEEVDEKVRLLFARPFYFVNHYVRRGLWREGWYGFAVANIAAHGRWLKDAKMLEIYLRRRDAAKTGKN